MIPTSILKLFGKSPIRPLEKHMLKVNECTSYLLDFFVAVFESNWEIAKENQEKVATLEQEADDMKRDIRLHLPKSIFLQVSRSDILELLAAQDRVANKAKDIAGLTLGRKMVFPEKIIPKLTDLLKCSLKASQKAALAISKLSNLSESAFSGSETTVVEEMIHELYELETESDDLQREVRAELFLLEHDIQPVEVMFLYKIIEWIGDLSDRAEHIGSRLQLLLAK